MKFKTVLISICAVLIALPVAFADTRGRQRRFITVSGSGNEIPSATPPLPYKSSFLEWREDRVDYLVNRASTAPVSTIYYVASAGSNAADGLTPATAKQTLAHINSLLSSGQRVQILLNRGDTFAGGFTIPATGTFKIGAYGTGNKPIVTMFSSTGYLDADNAWTLDSGNRYVKTVAPEKGIGWIRERSNAYNPYTYLTSAADVALLPYSWFQATSTATFTANASNEQITSTGHGLSEGNLIWLSTTGTIPGGTETRKNYYVKFIDANTFQISETNGGAAVNISSTGSGTHSWTKPGNLYINAGGADPNGIDYEVTPDWNDHTEGYTSSGGGTGAIYYAADIVFEGHGVSPYQDASRGIYNVHPNVSGTDLFVAERVEAYYSGRHGIGHTNGAANNGSFVLKDCAAGYGSIDATSYVSFTGGSGLESHYQGCSNPFGKLPSTNYAALYGPVYQGGPSNSGLYAHTAGGTLGTVTVWDHEFQDNRATYPRATYELGDITAADLAGTATDVTSLRTFFNHAPIDRLITVAPATVTANATTDVIEHSSNGYADGDIVQITTSTTMPGSVTSNRSYGVVNRDANGYQLGAVSINVASTGVNASTDTLTMISAHALSNTNRVKIIAEYGQLPGGLDSTTLYYVISASGSDLQLSLTSGGSAVDITDSGFGRFRVYGQIVNISSAGTGTITAKGVKANSGFYRNLKSAKAVYINNKKTGLQFQTYGGTSLAYSFNEIAHNVNMGLATTGLQNGGSREFHAHYRSHGRGSFWYINASSGADAMLFNSIVSLPSNIYTQFNVTNDTDHMRGNAYFDPGNLSSAGSSTDDYKVSLSTDPTIGAAPGATFDTEGFPSANGLVLEYDFNGASRNTSTPSIGPIR